MIRNHLLKLLPLILLIFLFGCSNDGFILKGESEHWQGKFRVNTSGNNQSGEYTFYYKNDDWRDIGKYTVTIGDNELILNEDGLMNRSIAISVSYIHSTHLKENTKDVVIEWNGEQENIKLSQN